MLTISKRVWLAAGLASLAALTTGTAIATGLDAPRTAGSTAAAGLIAQPGGDCPPNDPSCYVQDEDDPQPPPPGTPGGDEPGGGGGGPCVFTQAPTTVADDTGQQSRLMLVAQTSIEVPCNHPQFGFYSGGCYYGNPPPLVEPPASPPDGQTAEDGAYYYQRCIGNVQVFNGELVFTFTADIQWVWLENGELPVPLPTPEEVALDWLATIDLFGVDPELAPPETGSGLVALPVWLGINGTANTWGTIDDSHCLQGVCVSIQALVATVDWTMGDGASFSCDRDQHVVWQPGMDYLAPGDRCHHIYQQSSRNQPDGKYQITATSNWAVHWEADASDAEGDLETTREATVALEINEIQVLTR